MPDLADLLDVGGALRHVLQAVTAEDKLILLGLGDLDVDTRVHGDVEYDLLADEVANLDVEEASLVVLLGVHVDGKMGVDVAHLVLVALGHTNDHVVDDGADGAQGSDALPGAMVQLNRDDVLLGLVEVDRQVAQVLVELAYAGEPC